MIGQLISAAFMVLAADVIDRLGSSNEMHCQLQPKKTKVTALSLYITAKDALATLHY